MEPSTILGALIGGYINKVLPAWLTTVLLGALLTFITYKLVVRGVITWRNETEHKHEEDEQRQPLLENDHSSTSGIATEGNLLKHASRFQRPLSYKKAELGHVLFKPQKLKTIRRPDNRSLTLPWTVYLTVSTFCFYLKVDLTVRHVELVAAF